MRPASRSPLLKSQASTAGFWTVSPFGQFLNHPYVEAVGSWLRMRRRKAKPWCSRCVDSVSVQTLAVVVTVYALIGDDIRLAATSAPADKWFNYCTIAAILIFSFETATKSIGKDDYFLGFFFWLDVVATVSLLLDITWIYQHLFFQKEDGSLTRAGRMSRVGTRAGRVIRVIRLIRLIRIIKIYKPLLDIWTHAMGRKQEEQLKPGDATDDEVYQESRVGQRLSAMTTQKVIILILFMLLMLPNLTVETFFTALQSSAFYGADMMYRSWEDCTQNVSAVACNEFEQQLTMYIGYHRRQKAMNCDNGWSHAFGSNCELDLGWVGFLSDSRTAEPLTFNVDKESSMESQWGHLFDGAVVSPGTLSPETAEAFEKGRMNACKLGRFISLFDAGEPHCPEELRMLETTFISPRLVSIYEDPVISIVFDLRPWTFRSSVYNILQTVFVCAVLAVGAMVFSHDANKFVLQPIERMISKVEKIRDNPLYAMKLGDETYREKQEESDNVSKKRCYERGICKCGRRRSTKVQTLETKILENAIVKFGKLLALGFGEAGSEIIGKNMDDESATVNAMIAGNKVEAVFGFANIRNFADTTEVLQDKVMVFVNQVAEIVHTIVDTWHGAANRNIGDAFLIVWRVRDDFAQEMKTKVGDMSVISFVQVVAAINKSPVLKDYREHPALLARLPQYRVRMGFGLHYGWAIEGAIGSEFKIDASYLSPHVNMASRLEAMTKQYQVLILMSEPLTNLCSTEVTELFRTIDHVTLKGGMSSSIRLHIVDLNAEVLSPKDPVPKKAQNPFELRMQREKAKEEKLDPAFLVYPFFFTDPDIVQMRQYYPARFFQLFAKGYLNYEAGEWDVAKSVFEMTLDMLGETDGPTKALLTFMAQYDNVPSRVTPKGWPGWRELTET